MRRWVGRWLMGVAALHAIVGLVAFAAPLREIVAAGGWNALGTRDPLRNLAFWFLFCGVLLGLVGYLADWIERIAGGALPRPLGVALLASAVAGVVLAPASGFWLVFPAALGVFQRPPRKPRPAPAA